MQRVKVTYHDNTSRETTVDELREYLTNKGEDKNWVSGFINQLVQAQSAFTDYATYTLL